MLRGLLGLIAFLVATPVCAFSAIVVESINPGVGHTMRVGQIWSRIHLWAIGVRPVYEGHVPTEPWHASVFVANHQSIVDIWAVAPALPLTTRFVAKKSLFRIPLMGWAMSAGGFIPIDRARRESAMGSLGLAAEALAKGYSVILFPEGTRSRDGRLLPFKRGAFHLALGAKVPVVPIAVSGTGGVVRRGSMVVKPGTVRVWFGEPIQPGAFRPDDTDGLMATARGAIVENLGPEERPQEPQEVPGP